MRHRHRRAGISDVRPRKTRLNADDQNAGLLLETLGASQELNHGARLAAAVIGTVDLRAMPHQAGRPDLPRHYPLQ